MIREAIEAILAGVDLAEAQAETVMEEIMDGAASSALVSAYLVALRAKGETVSEVVGSARGMRNRARPSSLDGLDAMDICGTGGDGQGTFNISTATAFVVAGAGVPVAKHGNRAASSRCGAADVLEALGARLELDPRRAAECVRETGFGFYFAPAYHPAMKNVAPVRRELRTRTVFNLLGPLTHPAGVRAQLVGVYDDRLRRPLAEVLQRLGVENAAVVHGEGGYDEATTVAPARVDRVSPGGIASHTLDPEDLGFPRAKAEDLRGGDAGENASILKRVLAGEGGFRLDTVLLNAGLALHVAGKAADVRKGVARAREAIDSGRAVAVLENFVAFSNREDEPGEGFGGPARCFENELAL